MKDLSAAHQDQKPGNLLLFITQFMLDYSITSLLIFRNLTKSHVCMYCVAIDFVCERKKKPQLHTWAAFVIWSGVSGASISCINEPRLWNGLLNGMRQATQPQTFCNGMLQSGVSGTSISCINDPRVLKKTAQWDASSASAPKVGSRRDSIPWVGHINLLHQSA
jgi:hypothetical protein